MSVNIQTADGRLHRVASMNGTNDQQAALQIDSELSPASTNPLMNKAIYELFSNLEKRISALETAGPKYTVSFSGLQIPGTESVLINGKAFDAGTPVTLAGLSYGDKVTIEITCKEGYVFTTAPSLAVTDSTGTCPGPEKVTVTCPETSPAMYILEFTADKSYGPISITGAAELCSFQYRQFFSLDNSISSFKINNVEKPISTDYTTEYILKGSKVTLEMEVPEGYILDSGLITSSMPDGTNIPEYVKTVSDDEKTCTIEFTMDKPYTNMMIQNNISKVYTLDIHNANISNIKSITFNGDTIYTNGAPTSSITGNFKLIQNQAYDFIITANDGYVFGDDNMPSLEPYAAGQAVPSTTAIKISGSSVQLSFRATEEYGSATLNAAAVKEIVKITFHHITGTNIKAASINGAACTVASGGSYISIPVTEFDKGSTVNISLTATDDYAFDSTTKYSISNYAGTGSSYPVPSCTTSYQNDNKTCVITFTADKAYSALALSVSALVKVVYTTYKISIHSISISSNIESITINGTTFTDSTNRPLTQQLYSGTTPFSVTEGEDLEISIKTKAGTSFASNPNIVDYNSGSTLASASQQIPYSDYYIAKIFYTVTANHMIIINAK